MEQKQLSRAKDSVKGRYIHALVKMAKASTKYVRFIVGIVVVVPILLPVNIAPTFIGVVPFQALVFWFYLILVLFLSNVITSVLEQYIIKYQLKKSFAISFADLPSYNFLSPLHFQAVTIK